MGLTNVIVKIPFCRRIEEMEKVQEEMAKNGLKRGENGLEVFMMGEIPAMKCWWMSSANTWTASRSGSNDLTQLVLGIDRDSALLAREFDERDPAVMKMVAHGSSREQSETANIAPSTARRPAITRSTPISWSRKGSAPYHSTPTQ